MSKRILSYRGSQPGGMPAPITPTALSLTLYLMYGGELWQDRFTGCPALWSHSHIGDGVLTARSRAEVARITRNLGGKL
jgi:hypothetical protein